MNKKFLAYFSLLIILVFIGYIIYDTALSKPALPVEEDTAKGPALPEKWILSREFQCNDGDLTSVSVSGDGTIYLGGESFISSYDRDFRKNWLVKTNGAINTITVCGDTVLGATSDLILVLNREGKLLDEWGSFEDNSLITSVYANKSNVVFTDAGNKMAVVLDRNGRVKSMIGQTGEKFVIPSPYFDIAINDENTIFVANTGHRRIEARNLNGELTGYFGSPGTAPASFCGCCNPAHFTLIPGGFITAEKGINRIKILNKYGEFVEWVSTDNKFLSSVPVDIASPDGKTIYAANPADSRLSVFKRKD